MQVITNLAFADRGNHPISKIGKGNFIENKGQWEDQVLFLSRNSGYNAWLIPEGMVYDFYLVEGPALAKGQMQPDEQKAVISGHVIKMKWLNASANGKWMGINQAGTSYNYILGNDQKKWVSDVKASGEVMRYDLYPHINLRYYQEEGSIRHDYVVEPGGRIQDIRFQIEGAEQCKINERGELEIQTSLGLKKLSRPFTYQLLNDEKKEIASHFVDLGDGNFCFSVSQYDSTKTLTIDPILFSTYIGGDADDNGYSMDITPAQEVFVCGNTASSNFPVSVGAYQTVFVPNRMGYVAKLDQTLSNMVYCTYLGGTNVNQPTDLYDIAVEPVSGNAYVVGWTSSQNYPTFMPMCANFQGGIDGVLTVLNAAGNAFVYSTYIAGNAADNVMSIRINPSNVNDVFVAGYTASTNFPVPTAGPAGPTIGGPFFGNLDGFITRIDIGAGVAGIQYSRYLTSTNGLDQTTIMALDLDAGNAAYVTGYCQATTPTAGNIFPGLLFGTLFPGQNVFVTKVDGTGNIVYSTFGGSSANDRSYGIRVDGAGVAYFAGRSDGGDFPINLGPTYGGGSDAFVAKVNSSGTAVDACYVGGAGWDEAWDLTLANGDVYITGQSQSVNFPSTPCPSATNGGDVFVTRLDPSLNTIIYSEKFGGTGGDQGMDIAVDASGIYVVGKTNSNNFPTTPPPGPAPFDNTYNSANNWTWDIFATKLTEAPPFTITAGSNSPLCAGATLSLSASGPAGLSFTWAGPNGFNSVLQNPTLAAVTLAAAGTYTVTALDANGCTASSTVLVQIQSLPPIPTITLTNPCLPSGGSLTLNVTAPSGAVAQLNGGAPFAIPAGFLITAIGTYTVTAISGTAGCTSSTTTVINACPIPCNLLPTNPATVYVPNGTTASAMWPANNFPSAVPVVFDGTFTVDQNLDMLNNPNVFFTPNSQIIIQSGSGSVLQVSNSTLQGCSELWQGIKATTPTESVVINSSSVIKDMSWGVEASVGALIDCQNSTFIDNNVGIRLRNTPVGFNLANGTCQIRNNTFTSSGNPLLPPMQSQAKSEIGIYLERCQEVEIGLLDYLQPADKNRFETLYTGIYSVPAAPSAIQNLKFYNNDFMDIQDDPYAGMFPEKHIIDNCYQTRRGAGIYIEGYDPAPLYFPGNSHSMVVEHVPHGGSFDYCDKAIVGSYVNARVQNVTVDHTYMGFMFTNAEKNLFEIGDPMIAPGSPTNNGLNGLQGVFIGIQILGNPADDSYVNYNSQILRNAGIISGTNGQEEAPVGIDLKQFANPTRRMIVTDNSVYVPGWSGTGIRLTNTGSRMNCLLNLMTFDTQNGSTWGPGLFGPEPELIGIDINNCKESILKGNKVYGYLMSQQAWAQRRSSGIKMELSTRLHLECNDIRDTRFGFWVNDQCGTTNVLTQGVINNSFDNHQHAMFFTFGANEGTLNDIGTTGLDYGNTFTNTNANRSYNSGHKLFRLAMNGGYNNNIYSNSLTNLESWSNFSGASRYVPFPSNSIVTPCLPPYNIQDPEVGGEVDEQFAATVLGDSLQSYTFPEMGEYMLSHELYSQLDMDSLGRVNNLDYNTFYTTESDSALGKLYQLDESLGSLTLTDSIIAQQQILLAATLNNSVLPTYSFESNDKEINTIYLQFIQFGWDSLSAIQKSFVETLAKSCLYTHGYGVYKARMLWANAEPALDYNDLFICTAGNNKADVFVGIKEYLNGSIDTSKSETTGNLISNSIIVYPNPAKDEIRIRHNYRDFKELKFELFDNAGRRLKTMVCQNCENEIVISLDNIAVGLYTYNIILDNKRVSQGKVSVIK